MCCQNCGTERRPIYRNQLCGRCSSAARKLATIEAWVLSKPKSLKGYPSGSLWRRQEYFSIFRKGAMSQARARLEDIKSGEELWKSGTSGIIIERLLCRLAAKCGCRYWVYDGAATRVDHGFGFEEKRELFRLLYEIEEKIPWRGIDIRRILTDYERSLERKANKPALQVFDVRQDRESK